MSSHIASADYRRLLENWLPYATRDLYTPPDRRDLLCYGTGEFNWGAQTHTKAFSAYAVLATDPDYAGHTPREELLEQSLRMLRFCLQSHVEGNYHCLDGRHWGHTWISVLGVERMMHAVEALEPYLTDEDQAQLRLVLTSEANWLMDHYDIKAGLIENNKPESNLWNGAFLHRTAMMYPDAPRTAEYRYKGTHYLMNAISVPEDEFCDIEIDGRPVKDWHVGANFFSSMATNHHYYLNVGYKVICMSNAAMLHFAYKKRGLTAPRALYWHVDRLWDLLKNLTFEDGRLIRIGGDTRVRYCYCQDYAIPMWLMMADLNQDPACPTWEFGWLDLVRQEADNNADGSFLSDRCGQLRQSSPLYHTRLESDRANSLSMGAYWRREYQLTDTVQPETTKPTHVVSWNDDYHGAAFVRGEKRIASFVWRSGELPTGLVLPTGGSDFAEWRQNLSGELIGLGRRNFQVVETHHEKFFEDGFLTYGRTRFVSEDHLAEGSFPEPLALNQLVFAALPDDSTVIVLQHCKTMIRSYLRSSKGLFWQIPNDLWNDYTRTFHAATHSWEMDGRERTEQVLPLITPWLNVDDQLGLNLISSNGDLTLYHPANRQIGLKQKLWQDPFGPGGMLLAEEICAPCNLEPHNVDANTTLFHNAFTLRVANAEYTATFAAEQPELECTTDREDVDAVLVRGADNNLYLLCANFGEETHEAKITLPRAGTLTELGELVEPIELVARSANLTLPAGAARLFRFE